MDRNPIIRKWLAIGIIFLFIGTYIIPGMAQTTEKSQVSRGTWLYVGGNGPGNYTRIQDAIDNANNGDTVFVYDDSSPYVERLWIKSSIHLIGENAETTVIDGQYDPFTIEIRVDNVTVHGFTVNGCLSFGTCHCYVDGNQFIFPEGQERWGAILLYGGGLYNVISNNIIWNAGCGIYLGTTSGERVENNTVSQNVVVSSGIGIYVRGSEYQIVRFNTISNNSLVNNDLGIHIGDYTVNNFAYNNNVVGDVVSAVDYGWPCNNWNENFWSDYTGNDTNGDGIGDTPYNISSRGQDLHPLMMPVYCLLPVPIVYVNPVWDENATWHIWRSIQRGIDDSKSWSTVFVFPGFYTENLLVNKSLTLVGQKRQTTIIDGNGTGSTIVLHASHIALRGFTIQHSGVNGNNAGVKIERNENPVDDISITNNIIKENWHGIYIDSSWNDFFCNNLITGNFMHGIYDQNYLGNTIIADNSITNNSNGISIFGANNTASENTIMNNIYGIISGNNTDNNLFYHNNFINNTKNAQDSGNNIWDDGYPSGGNYWDDYTGADDNNDGIGDTSYDIPGGNNQDLFPFMEPDGWLKEYRFQKAFIFGKITNSSIGMYITFKAVKTRVITLKPLSFHKYVSGEWFIILKHYQGFIGKRYVFAQCEIMIRV